MAYIDFLTKYHTRTKRDYLERVCTHDKVACAEKAVAFGHDYWDGDRSTGYGGYRYDGRWRTFADDVAKHYGLKPGDRVLDVGCGKGFQLYEFTQAVPGVEAVGIDISEYAIENSKEEIRPFLKKCSASELPFDDNSFDLVFSLNALHNMYIFDLWKALKEIERVAKGAKYLVVEAYRNEREKVNLMYWQLTCRAFHTPQEWEWIYREAGYTGDHSFIFFE